MRISVEQGASSEKYEDRISSKERRMRMLRIGIRGVMNIERRLRWNIENTSTENLVLAKRLK